MLTAESKNPFKNQPRRKMLYFFNVILELDHSKGDSIKLADNSLPVPVIIISYAFVYVFWKILNHLSYYQFK